MSITAHIFVVQTLQKQLTMNKEYLWNGLDQNVNLCERKLCLWKFSVTLELPAKSILGLHCGLMMFTSPLKLSAIPTN